MTSINRKITAQSMIPIIFINKPKQTEDRLKYINIMEDTRKNNTALKNKYNDYERTILTLVHEKYDSLIKEYIDTQNILSTRIKITEDIICLADKMIKLIDQPSQKNYDTLANSMTNIKTNIRKYEKQLKHAKNEDKIELNKLNELLRMINNDLTKDIV